MFNRTEVDFGEVRKGSSHSVEISYLGEEPFDMNKLQTFCNCTKKEYHKDRKILELKVSLNNPGKWSNSVIYRGNPENPQVITLKAEVK